MKIQNPKSKIQTLTEKSKGQIVLVLVLITVVGLTIGLSLISRTISDIRISSQIEQSSRAFSAAEAGVESALKGTSIAVAPGTVDLGDASASYEVLPIGGGSIPLVFSHTQPGEVQTAWLINHDDQGILISSGAYPVDQPLTVCFGSVGTTKPAVILTFVYSDGPIFKIAKAAYDSDSSRGNGFGLVDSTVSPCPSEFAYWKTILPTDDLSMPLATSTLYILRIQVVYAGTSLAVVPNANYSLPVQGKLITSVGKSDTGIVRRIQVSQGYGVLPFLMDFALFLEN